MNNIEELITKNLNEIYKTIIEEIDFNMIHKYNNINADGTVTLYEYIGPLFNIKMYLEYDIVTGSYGIYTVSQCGARDISTYKSLKQHQQLANDRLNEYEI